MKKFLKKTLIILASILVLILIVGFIGWSTYKSNVLSFEKDYPEKTDIETLTENGYQFSDRNGNGQLDVYEDDRKSIKERVADLLSQMTVEEKIHVLKGSGMASAIGLTEPGEGIPGAVGTIVPTPRLGIPTVYLSDGPAGLRIEPLREGEDRTYYCTAFPIATLLASTWNTDLVHEVGNAMGNEAKEYGIDVILGPGANIHRHPFCGRNFEYYSEDPVLSGKMGAAIINGIESNGIGTSVKHFVANNQETERTLNDVIVSERAMREIYLKGFEIIVEESQPWTIMSSYNKINGTYTSQSKYLLTDILRDDWGFEGLVMTDWFGGRDAAAQITAGNDLLEPGTKKQWKALKDGYENGELSIDAIDKSVSRILELVFKTRKMKNYENGNNPDLEAHAAITRQSASEGMVLLKNEDVLPLETEKNVALLGVTSYDFIAGGTGSGDVNEAYTVSLEEGLEKAGFVINAEAKDLFETHKKANADDFVKPEGLAAMFNPYIPPEITYTSDQLKAIVSSSDVGVLTIGRNAGEGGDRVETDDFLLKPLELDMIKAITDAFQSAGKKLIIVLNIGGVIETASWKDQPDAILLAWQGGQEGGNSVADILSGTMNPSGKLPVTFPVHVDDHASNANFPKQGGHMSLYGLAYRSMFPKKERPDDEKVRNIDYTHYDEGIYVGYRHFDKAKLDVSYPFGYGLSYTEFEFSEINIEQANDSITVALNVTNSGQYAGKEVLQLYVSKLDSGVDRPIRELKGFKKTKNLEPVAVQTISMSIPVSALRYWDEEKAKWLLEGGLYEFHIGTSSRTIEVRAEIEL